VQGQPAPEWRDYGGTTAGRRFAALDQINKQNVDRLTVAWTFRTGESAHSNPARRSRLHGKPGLTPATVDTQDQNTPIQVGNSLYLCTPHNVVIAIEADTGRPLWRFDPHASAPGWQRCRGVAYHEGPVSPGRSKGAGCNAQIFVATNDARLIALDARNGRPCKDFGVAGTVDLTRDLGPVKRGDYSVTAAPLVAGNHVVIGGRVVDNQGYNVPGGVVRAFDASSGSLVWAFDSGNPAITTVPPTGQSYSRGSPNVWSALAYDPKLRLIYLPTANPAPDRSGKRRTALDEAYGSSVVALDARDGRPRWKFQTVHHDLWDYDVPSQPLLIDLPDGRGRMRPALVQTTKTGQIFVLDRVNGLPIARVVERPVPRIGGAKERHARTQPFSVGMPQIGMATLRETDMWGVTPIDQMLCRIAFRRMRYAGPFTPPGHDVSLSYPGPLGGMNWGSAAVDEGNHILIVNDSRIGYWLKLGAESSTSDNGKFPVFEDRFVSVLGLPCQAPPYGTLSGVDLINGKLLWQIPIGTVEDYKVRKIPLGLSIPIGMPSLGGPMVTQAGLVFFAGAEDHYLRAIDIGTGRERWKGRIPVGAQATPMTYVSPRSGRQYVVISAGGARTSSDRGDYVVAFALR
jgi:quinate dehydrogenase (quinone)